MKENYHWLIFQRYVNISNVFCLPKTTIKRSYINNVNYFVFYNHRVYIVMESAIVYLKLRMKKFLKFVGVLPISIGPVWKSIEGFVVVPHLCAWMKYLTELENTTRSLTSPQCNLPQMVVLPTTAIQQNQYKKYNKNLIIGFSQKCYFYNSIKSEFPNLF